MHEGDCPACYQHASAELALVGVACPACGNRLKCSQAQEVIVSETPEGESSERYARVPVVRCPTCRSHVGLWPVELCSSQEHADTTVLFTGGGKYMAPRVQESADRKIRSVIRGPISEFLSRRSTEPLDQSHLETWIVLAISELLAKELKNAGMVPGGCSLPVELVDLLREVADKGYCECADFQTGCSGQCPGAMAKSFLAAYGVSKSDDRS